MRGRALRAGPLFAADDSAGRRARLVLQANAGMSFHHSAGMLVEAWQAGSNGVFRVEPKLQRRVSGGNFGHD